MKKLIPLLLLLALLLSACAGSHSGDKQAAQSEPAPVDTAETLAADHTVISAENQRTAPVNAHLRRALCSGDPDDQVFQEPEGMQGLGDTVPPFPDLLLHVHTSSPSIRRTTALISSNRPITFP